MRARPPNLSANTAWTEAWMAYQGAETAYHDARGLKDRMRAELEALVRVANNKAQVVTGMTPEVLGVAGLPVHKEGRMLSAAKPVQVPEFQILHPESRKLNLPFRESGTGGGSPSRGKPEGVKSIEFWVKVGAPAPATDSDLVFLKAFQRSPAQVDFRLEDIGKPMWVSARWVNTRGEPGVFSPIQNTVIS